MHFISRLLSRPTEYVTFFMFLIFLTIPVPALHAELVDKIVGIVNNEVITLSEINAETKEVDNKIKSTVPTADQQEALEKARESALNSIIDKKLINQKAAEARVSVNDQEIEAALQEVRNRASLTEEQFTTELGKAGLSLATYRDNLRSQLLQRKIVNYDIRSKIVITEAMMRKYYDTEYTFAAQSNEYYLLQIGCKWETKPTDSAAAVKTKKQDALLRAQRIHNLASDGQDFGSLAQQHSDFPSAQSRGDIGAFTLDDMSATMRDAVSVLKPGEVSTIIDTPVGYQFFKLLSGEQGHQVAKAPYEQVKETIRATLFEQKMQSAFKEWITELKSSAYIQKL